MNWFKKLFGGKCCSKDKCEGEKCQGEMEEGKRCESITETETEGDKCEGGENKNEA